MSRRWTLEDDLLLAEWEGVDANFIAEQDLGRTAKGAGTRRVKALKEAGVWDKIQDYIKARDIMRCHHTLAFSTSGEAKMIAAETLRELGGELTDDAKQILLISDERLVAANECLAQLDAKHATSTPSIHGELQ